MGVDFCSVFGRGRRKNKKHAMKKKRKTGGGGGGGKAIEGRDLFSILINQKQITRKRAAPPENIGFSFSYSILQSVLLLVEIFSSTSGLWGLKRQRECECVACRSR